MLYNMSFPHDQTAMQPVKPVAVAAAARPRPRCSQPMPFDPEELSQKLAKVLADQRLHAERRRRARADAAAAAAAAPALQDTIPPTYTNQARECLEKGSVRPGHPGPRSRTEPLGTKLGRNIDGDTVRPKSYAPGDNHSRGSQCAAELTPRPKADDDDDDDERQHFIPQVAAAQFVDTTTTTTAAAAAAGAESVSDNKGLVCMLSRTALKLAQGHRERQQDRANTQRQLVSEQLTDLGSSLAGRDRAHHRHTIEVSLGAGQTAAKPQARRVSAGDLLMTWDSGVLSPPYPPPYDPAAAAEGLEQNHQVEQRADWTQSDETPPQTKSRSSPRKADPIGALRNKLGALTKHGREEARSRETSPPPSDATRSPPKAAGFFARFKVNH